MLRKLVGDATFFRGVQAYLKTFAGKTVETDDFRKCLEDSSGQNLTLFFDQVCYLNRILFIYSGFIQRDSQSSRGHSNLI